MAAPADYALTITVNSVDATAFVPYDSISFEDHARTVSNFNFTIENPSGLTPARAQTVTVVAKNLTGTPTIFTGLIIEIETTKRDNGIATEYKIEAADQKIRLQKSIVSYNEFSGTDESILSSLLSSAYPDLSSFFDFATDITSFMDDLELIANDDSLLDLLNELAELSNNAAYRFDTVAGNTIDTVTFDAGGYGTHTETTSGMDSASVTTGGNPDDCYKGLVASASGVEWIQVDLDFGAQVKIEKLYFDIYVSTGGASTSVQLSLWVDGTSPGEFVYVFTDGVWTSEDSDGLSLEDHMPLVANSSIGFRIRNQNNDSSSWDIRIDNLKVDYVANDATVDFDGGASYTTAVVGMASSAVESGGNPGNNFRATSNTTPNSVTVFHDLGSMQTIYGMCFSYKLENNISGSSRWRFYIKDDVDSIVFDTGSQLLPVNKDDNTWRVRSQQFTPVSGQKAYVEMLHGSTSSAQVYHVDNILIVLDAGTIESLQWDQTPDVADFNIDVQSGDEFAFDLDLMEGDLDDFNSVTVIGGYEDVSIDWTFESDGDMEHFDLELPVKSIVVYKNTNTDGSPTWTLQTDGVWGTDDLTGAGGSADVLYDPDNHWLLFNSNPSNLSKSIRVTGTIQKPIRVRVENVSGSDPTFATVLHDENVTSTDQAVAVGQAALDKRNSITRLDFTTYEPGLKPGQSIAVVDSARGLSETLTIQRITTKWLGASGHAKIKVHCGNDEETGADSLLANNDRRSRQKALPAATTLVTVNILTDDSSEQLTDDSNELLYEAV